MVDVVIDSNVSASPEQAGGSGPVWTSDLVGYSFFKDDTNELVYRKTLDGGASWGARVTVGNGDTVTTFAVWFDKWTPGQSGTLIHIVWTKSDGADAFSLYRNLDTADDSLSSVGLNIQLVGTTATYQDVSVTKSRGGVLFLTLYAVPSGLISDRLFRSADNGATWVSRAAFVPSAPAPPNRTNETARIMPGNLADPNDMLIVHGASDTAAGPLEISEYDDSMDSWAAPTTLVAQDIIAQQYGVTIRHSDNAVLVAAATTNGGNHIDFWEIVNQSTITAKTRITVSRVFVRLCIDQVNGDIYVFYTRGSPFDQVYRRTSSDGMTTWGVETQCSVDAPALREAVSVALSVGNEGGNISAHWREASSNDQMTNTDCYVVVPPAAAATVTLSGTVVPSVTEDDIRAGGETIVLTVDGDVWVATVGEDNAITQALIDGLDSDEAEGSGWDVVVKGGLTFEAVVRTSDTVVTITLPAFPLYNIAMQAETITATVPASALDASASEVVATPTFDITLVPLRPRRIMDSAQVREYITLVTPDGTRYPMNTPHQFGRWVISDSGKGTPPIDYITQRGPFQHGATVKDFFLAPRVIQLLIRQEFCDRLDWWDGRGDLLDAIRPNRQTIATAAEPFQLEWCLPTGERRQINCFITEGPRFEPRQLARWDEWAFQEVLRFICYDPLFFDPTRVDSAFTIALAAHLIFPITFPIQFGSGTISDTLNITYEGTWETYPTIVITGPLEDPIIRNTTTGEKLEFAVDIGVGRTVTIDLAYGAKTVVDDLGNNLIGNLSADSDLATFHIAPAPEAPNGVNVLTLTGTNPTGATSVTIRYFTRYFGI